MAIFQGDQMLVKGAKEVLRDGGPRYNILSALRIPHRRQTFGRRNEVEQTFRTFKHPSPEWIGTSRGTQASVLTWIEAFVNLYNLLQRGE
jgi:transposase-like protein